MELWTGLRCALLYLVRESFPTDNWDRVRAALLQARPHGREGDRSPAGRGEPASGALGAAELTGNGAVGASQTRKRSHGITGIALSSSGFFVAP